MARYIQVLGTRLGVHRLEMVVIFGNAEGLVGLSITLAARLVTVETSAGATIGTFTLGGNQEIYVRKR